MDGTTFRQRLSIVRGLASRWRSISAFDEPSFDDRIVATVRSIDATAVPTLLGAVGLCGAYAYQHDAPLLMLAALPMLLAQFAAATLLPGARFARRTYATSRGARRVLLLFPPLLGIAWIVPFFAIASMPIVDD